MGEKWTPEQVSILKEMYADHTASEIGKIVGRPYYSVYNKAQRLGLKASPERLREQGKYVSSHPNSIATRYQKGSISYNKGKKVSPEVYEKLKATMFKKGQVTHNMKPVGSERKRGDGDIYIKIAEPGKWMPKHRYIWEQHNGKIPKGYTVRFRNGDRTDFRIENLYLEARADLLKNENCMMARYPEELRKVIYMKAAIKKKITDYKKKQNGEQSQS